MQEHIGDVVPSGPQSVELTVQQMRQPGQRMPIRAMFVGEDPGDAGERQPVGHLGILSNVHIVIIVDEFMAGGLAEDQRHGQQQENTSRNACPWQRRGTRR